MRRICYDAPSTACRARLIYRWLFDGVDFRNAEVADFACGSGHNSLALKQRFDGVRTIGFLKPIEAAPGDIPLPAVYPCFLRSGSRPRSPSRTAPSFE
jgi:hypothetical protein